MDTHVFKFCFSLIQIVNRSFWQLCFLPKPIATFLKYLPIIYHKRNKKEQKRIYLFHFCVDIMFRKVYNCRCNQKGDGKLNQLLLDYHIKSNGLNRTDLAKKMHISLSALNRKMSEKSDFKRNEIQQIKSLLNLDDNDVKDIFFDDDVS